LGWRGDFGIARIDRSERERDQGKTRQSEQQSNEEQPEMDLSGTQEIRENWTTELTGWESMKQGRQERLLTANGR
jgi:hypothetical protein